MHACEWSAQQCKTSYMYHCRRNSLLAGTQQVLQRWQQGILLFCSAALRPAVKVPSGSNRTGVYQTLMGPAHRTHGMSFLRSSCCRTL